jgi:hypothetical protein
MALNYGRKNTKNTIFWGSDCKQEVEGTECEINTPSY